MSHEMSVLERQYRCNIRIITVNAG